MTVFTFHPIPFSGVNHITGCRALIAIRQGYAMTAKSNSCIMPNTYAVVSRMNAENETRIRGSVIAAEPKPKRLKMTSRRANEFSYYIYIYIYSIMYI